MKRRFAFITMVIMMSGITLIGQEDLVAHWSFDSIEGNSLIDKSENANHGTNYGGVLVDGVVGKAIYFNGNGAYARIPGDGQPPPQVISDLWYGTVSLWFRVDHIPDTYGIAPILYYGSEEKCNFFDAANQGLIIEVGHSPVHYGSKRVYFTIWKNGCTFPSFCFDSWDPIREGEWYHMVVVVGKSYNTGYLNGKEMLNRWYNFGGPNYTQFFSDAVVHEKMWLGRGHWDGTTQSFRGAIDELRIFSRDLDTEEINALYEEANSSTGIEVASISAPIMTYPNPVSDVLFYDHSGLDTSFEGISLVDNKGRVVLEVNHPEKSAHLDITHLPVGLYSLEFKNNESTIRKKVIIAR